MGLVFLMFTEYKTIIINSNTVEEFINIVDLMKENNRAKRELKLGLI